MHILTECPNICYQSCLSHTQPQRLASALASAPIRVARRFVRCAGEICSRGNCLFGAFCVPFSIRFSCVCFGQSVRVCEWVCGCVGVGGRECAILLNPRPKTYTQKHNPNPFVAALFTFFISLLHPQPQRGVCVCVWACLLQMLAMRTRPMCAMRPFVYIFYSNPHSWLCFHAKCWQAHLLNTSHDLRPVKVASQLCQ